MKISLLQSIATQIKTVIDRAYLYSPELDLNSKEKPFVVVHSLTDLKKIVTFEQAKETEYYIWIYVYPKSNEYSALELPELIRDSLFTELTVTVEDKTYKSMPLDITTNRLNGKDNDMERYGSVITCIYRIYQ